MGCCGPTPTGAGTTALDDGKRVNYTLGMLLGVDDFLQEAAYQNARRHELARELLGYGTARGLQVLLEGSGSEPRVRVTPGMAWMPSGRAVCVGSEQCCDLNAWLLQQAPAINKAVQGAGANPVLPVFVVLSFAECLTDLVPIPGEPCRSDDKLTAASRITDGFRLELRLSAPPQREEDAIRDFADWLSAVPVDTTSPAMSETDFMNQLRAAAQAWLVPSSPPVSPSDFMFGSPPATLVAGGQLLHAAFTLWVTELRPLWRARYGCGPGPLPVGTPDDAVLLAEVALALESTSAGWQVDDARASRLDESRRPVLLSLRMVQELVTRNPAPEPAFTVQPEVLLGQAADAGSGLSYARADHTHGTPTLSGDATAIDEAGVQRVRVEGLRRDPIAGTTANIGDALVLRAPGGNRAWTPEPFPLPIVPGTTVVAEQSHGQPVVVGISAAYARADHSHGTPELSGDAAVVTEGAFQRVRIDGLRRLPIAPGTGNPGDVLVRRNPGGVPQWVFEPLPTGGTPGPSGDFVGRRKEAFGLIGAGHFFVDVGLSANGAPTTRAGVRDGSSYGGLVPLRGASVDGSSIVIEMRLPFENAGAPVARYIVKLTPVWLDEVKQEFMPYLIDRVFNEGDRLLLFRVRLRISDITSPSRFEFQAEVSRFEVR